MVSKASFYTRAKRPARYISGRNLVLTKTWRFRSSRAPKSSSKKFFINNWFLFDDPEVVDYLGVSQYYKYALNAKNFDSLFDYSPDEIEERVAKLSNGQKKSVAYRAKQLIADGVIDSNRKISALEKSLGVELIER